MAILATPAVSLPTTSTNDESLPSHSPSFAETHLTRSLTRHSYSSHHTHYPHSSTYNFAHSFLHPPTPIPTSGLASPHDSPQPHRHLLSSSQTHKNPIVIIFAAIGGIIGLVLLALLTRHAIAYFRLPRRNAVLTTAERGRLVREMAGYAQPATRRQRQSLIPPPPYEHAPSYELLTLQ